MPQTTLGRPPPSPLLPRVPHLRSPVAQVSDVKNILDTSLGLITPLSPNPTHNALLILPCGSLLIYFQLWGHYPSLSHRHNLLGLQQTPSLDSPLLLLCPPITVHRIILVKLQLDSLAARLPWLTINYGWNKVHTLHQNHTLVITCALPASLVSPPTGLSLGRSAPATRLQHRWQRAELPYPF